TDTRMTALSWVQKKPVGGDEQQVPPTALPRGSGLLHEVRGNWVFVERIVARDDRQAALRDEIVAPVLFAVVADHGAFGEMDIAVDDGSPDTAVPADVDMG